LVSVEDDDAAPLREKDFFKGLSHPKSSALEAEIKYYRIKG
jgi:hypothetical protein